MPELVAINEKGRRMGEDHHNAILTDGEVDLIRQLHDDGMEYEAIADKFGISKVTVGRICRFERRAESVVRYKRVKPLAPAPAEPHAPALAGTKDKPTAKHPWRYAFSKQNKG